MNKVATDDIGFAIYQVDLSKKHFFFGLQIINRIRHLLADAMLRILSALQAMNRSPDKRSASGSYARTFIPHR